MRGHLEACFQSLLDIGFAFVFVDFNLYLFTVINHDHGDSNFLRGPLCLFCKLWVSGTGYSGEYPGVPHKWWSALGTSVSE